MGILSLFRRRKAQALPPKERGRRTAEQAAGTPPTPTAGTPSAGPPLPTAVSGRGLIASSVLKAPAVTEKATRRQADGWYTFLVQPRATKPDIKRSVEEQFGVHVERVRVLNVLPKMRRRGPIEGWVPGKRKALVRLREGERIDLQAART